MPPPLQPYSNRAEPARGSSLQTIKIQQKVREEDEKIKLRRRRGIITQILAFLQENGYARSLDSLQQESGLTLHRSTLPADNVDMTTIFTEYEDYYEFRFGKRPKIYRTGSDGTQGDIVGGGLDFGIPVPGDMIDKRSGGVNGASSHHGSGNVCNGVGLQTGRVADRQLSNGAKGTTMVVPPHSANSMCTRTYSGVKAQWPLCAKSANNSDNNGNICRSSTDGVDSLSGTQSDIGITGTTVKLAAKSTTNGNTNENDYSINDTLNIGRVLKPLPFFNLQDQQDLANTIYRDILDQNPSVLFSDIAELDEAKHLLKEAILMPVKYPTLFEGICRPWKGILLFGPPGTGKTMLAKAVATECQSTFFNISASSIVSKWRGDSEKLVRMLFELAVFYSPSTIFIDELDSIMGARSNDGSEHEGSRRMKTELLLQMDGLSKRKNGDVVFVLAASNLPWDLDSAMLRRLEKRILVPLPSHSARLDMFRSHLCKVNAQKCGTGHHDKRSSRQSDPHSSAPLSEEALSECAAKTEGYSGADIDIICREATMRTVRKLIAKLEDADEPGQLSDQPMVRPSVTYDDVIASIMCTQSSAHAICLKSMRRGLRILDQRCLRDVMVRDSKGCIYIINCLYMSRLYSVNLYCVPNRSSKNVTHDPNSGTYTSTCAIHKRQAYDNSIKKNKNYYI